MQRKPPYMSTEETEDCSSEQHLHTHSINTIESTSIIDVWADNLHQQMEKISHLSKTYTVIAIDTEFPSIEEYNQKYYYGSNQGDHEKYIRLTKNVDSTQVIQLGLCLADQYGNVPQRFCWQFNFKYETEIQDISAQSAYLLKKAGINFQKFRQHGIPYKTFIHEFIKSGLLLNKKNRWVVFHGGYDFLYLLKLIRNQSSPKSIQEFYKSIKIYFPQKVDMKLVVQKEKRLKRFGLSKLSDTILCRRIGPQHQAGSDSLLTLQCYFKLRQQFEHLYENLFEIQNLIFGIGTKEYTKHENNFHKEHSYTAYQYGYGYMTQNSNQYYNMNSYNSQITYDPYKNYTNTNQYSMYHSYLHPQSHTSSSDLYQEQKREDTQKEK